MIILYPGIDSSVDRCFFSVSIYISETAIMFGFSVEAHISSLRFNIIRLVLVYIKPTLLCDWESVVWSQRERERWHVARKEIGQVSGWV